jgi:co-chaperonin GroES (HSP10)
MDRKSYSRGVEMSQKTITTIPADAKIRPTQDHIVVEPLETTLSNIIVILNEHKPVRGTVLAVGPGIYPKRYDHPDKQRRTKFWDGKTFRPTEIKVGDVVNLGGLEIGGYAFQTFYWGSKLCLMAQERDVALVEESHGQAA